ncbi:hypothetical protein AAG570_001778 [Ranatra chinensis]|uniref:Uncharacterized protein n=1 Tax=Ranatra chinensis TaxID=642074 RepID=A0ABD0Y9H9_9HEMI
MASEHKNMFYQNKKQDTTEIYGNETRKDGGEVNGGFVVDQEPKRKVSIASNPVLTEADRMRKISATSSQGRPRSILINQFDPNNGPIGTCTCHAKDLKHNPVPWISAENANSNKIQSFRFKVFRFPGIDFNIPEAREVAQPREG